jgi:hypothetical protein
MGRRLDRADPDQPIDHRVVDLEHPLGNARDLDRKTA